PCRRGPPVSKRKLPVEDDVSHKPSIEHGRRSANISLRLLSPAAYLSMILWNTTPGLALLALCACAIYKTSGLRPGDPQLMKGRRVALLFVVPAALLFLMIHASAKPSDLAENAAAAPESGEKRHSST